MLFLCTGNSARSQMAEALLRQLSKGRIEVFSAGNKPAPEVHPFAKETLEYRYGIDTSDLVPKSLDRFLGERFDYVITVCDRAAEVCPVFPGDPERIHWSFEDPSAATGSEADRLATFRRVRDAIRDRLRAWLAEIAPRASRTLKACELFRHQS